MSETLPKIPLVGEGVILFILGEGRVHTPRWQQNALQSSCLSILSAGTAGVHPHTWVSGAGDRSWRVRQALLTKPQPEPGACVLKRCNLQ